MAIAPSKLASFTGSKTRLVWTQQQSGCTDFVGAESDFRLLGFDSEIGERVLMTDIAAYSCPRFTVKGDRVVFNNNTDRNMYIMNWDGTGLRKLGENQFVLSTWIDPETGIEWVYSRPNTGSQWNSKSKPIIRIQIDNPSVTEEVWGKKGTTLGWFQPSKDGSSAAAVMFWPSCGIATLPQGRYKQFDKGCWTSLAPDNSGRMWVFDGDHRHVKLYNNKGKRLCRLDLGGAPAVKGWEVYHPRWSNNVRFITVTGPYSNNLSSACAPEEWDDYDVNSLPNFIPSGGYNVELFVGKLNEDLNKVVGWLRVTDNNKPDFHGDCWIEPRIEA
jgi:hypothetical protein